MRNVSWFKGLIVAVALFAALPATTGFAQSAQDAELGKNFEIIVLTPGHSRSIYYELHNTMAEDPTAVQATLIFTIGAGNLSINLTNATPDIGGGELVYAIAGFVGATPVLEYAYSTAAVNLLVPVNNAAVGMLATGILFGIGDVDMPVTFTMSYMLD